ncbi:MAG TPA: RcpC/CpaB family pilus assembly protein [Candidatus Limnocylindria bacterium]|nr:RcpC/CpaB family pilus assembly protein [Candidatus Limnocylindria bacterium]
MIPRRWLVALAVASGLVSGVVYEVSMQREDVVVVVRDVDVPRPLVESDVEVRSVSVGLVPDDAVRRREDVVGLIPRAPLLRGQIVVARAVSDELATFSSGLTVPSGLHAVAIPVSAVNAVGGAIAPGVHVDVLAIPILGRAPAGRTSELLASAVIVLDVRGESGAAFVRRDASVTVMSDRIASVVIAVAPADQIRVADRIATSTFVLALARGR